jgi:hypothetical protein
VDSKTIYIVSETYLPKVNWENYNGEEWIYIGVDQDFNEERVSQLVHSTLDGKEVYMITDRHESSSLPITDAIRTVKEGLQEQKYLLWDLSFNLVIEFGRIGVARKGKRG